MVFSDRKKLKLANFRSIHPEVFCGKGALKYFEISTYVGVSFEKDADLQTCNFIKKRLHRRCFPVNIAKCYSP